MKKSESFENKIERIENIIDELDNAELPLEELLKIYEEGMKLSAECREFLNKSEQKIIEIGKSYGKSDSVQSLD
ncbi:MAG: exodeoxyribonuclease VII small subunit [Candidatus Kapaibacterium sp.]|jgi:exodeoxyribonuclease VII small subunit|nr:exodeoxyribonuclease VII small subunit [Candidatus Kapabacteria bacterium]